jgi:hypothetical protein
MMAWGDLKLSCWAEVGQLAALDVENGRVRFHSVRLVIDHADRAPRGSIIVIERGELH